MKHTSRSYCIDRRTNEYKPRYDRAYLRPGSSDFLNCKSVDKSTHSGTERVAQLYTGDQLLGIATMHKSNAVPISKGSDMAIAVAKMRRG